MKGGAKSQANAVYCIYLIVIVVRGPFTRKFVMQMGVAIGFIVLPIVIAATSILSVIAGYQLGIESWIFFASIIFGFGCYHVLKTGFFNTSQVMLLQVH